MRAARWLARPWDEVHPELERLEIEYVVKQTKPQGRIQALGKARVVRVREKERLELVIACEVGGERQEVGSENRYPPHCLTLPDTIITGE